ncbi:GNAT superfamily N-acetyltransferase [Inquilinus ginsengisoli]|uniref:GNAT superfamily N-acetyltransferase n=1 Tax=Inquilinus ginsengisoli TaxID=363840 RepID=A0ABU1JQD2_9PROT|nr:GNAT family N-acetyltransferase [Inquilinus ginsengisoli]MDR6290234.1 GNAT superfamily N-acetyltransferase [Inquilinus ginsengisoli]
MAGFCVKPLDESTWPAFADLVERHNGVWGGCWCLNFHPEGARRAESVAERREMKQRRVRDGRAHAALVFDGPACVGWCQFGSAEELTNIKHKKAYREGFTALPDWRITCFFVARTHRGRGVAAAALEGALREIARLGGGTVESYPEDAAGRSVSSSFLHNATLSLFERQGFERVRRLGKDRWLVTRVLAPAAAGPA